VIKIPASIDMSGLDRAQQKFGLVIDSLEQSKARAIEKNMKPAWAKLEKELISLGDDKLMDKVLSYDSRRDEIAEIENRLKDYLNAYINELTKILQDIYKQIRILEMQSRGQVSSTDYLSKTMKQYETLAPARKFDLTENGGIEEVEDDEEPTSQVDMIAPPPEQIFPQEAPAPKSRPPRTTISQHSLTRNQIADLVRAAYFELPAGTRTGGAIAKILTQRGLSMASGTIRGYTARIGLKLEGKAGSPSHKKKKVSVPSVSKGSEEYTTTQEGKTNSLSSINEREETR
jgi:hypothetical protein